MCEENRDDHGLYAHRAVKKHAHMGVYFRFGGGDPPMANRARVVGIHPVAADEPVHLVEIEIEGGTGDFDFGEVTQEMPGQPRSNWQVVYDEAQIGENRFAFFFHYLDTAKPLLSPVGPLALPSESPIPEHLQGIEYVQP